MFYFFQRGTEFVRCALEGSRDADYHITITEPGGHERVESFPTSDAAHTRWVELQERFVADGWWGPHGRE